MLTQDGRIAKLLIGEDSRIEKEYLVRVEGKLDAKGLALLNHGLSLDGEALKPAKVSWQNEDQLRFVLREGKKRQIRRMCELVGLKVTGLKRVRIGSVKLGDLPLGQVALPARGRAVLTAWPVKRDSATGPAGATRAIRSAGTSPSALHRGRQTARTSASGSG